MKDKANATLPPWVDVSGNSNGDYWLSPAMPWLPVHDSDGEDEFCGLVLTALLQNMWNGKKFVEMRLEKRPFTLNADGTAEMCELGQTIAFGAMPIRQFLKYTEVPPGRRAMSRIFTFYEDDMDIVTTSVAGGIPYNTQIVVNVCRGYDKPKRFVAGCNYANMTFLFNEGAKSFEAWRDRLKESV